MTIRHLVSRLLPPILYDAARRRRNVSPSYISFEAARAACGAGYDDPDIARAIAHDTALRCERLTLPVPIFTLAEIKTIWAAGMALPGSVSRAARLRVIDFGGACGCHYYAVRAGLPLSVGIEWHVVETPVMVEAGTALAASLGIGHELHFHTSWEDARAACPAPDLVHSSSAIICTARPLECLEEHIACNARFMFFTRIGLVEDAPLYSVQSRLLSKGVKELPAGMRDRLVSYPLTWAPRRYFLRTLARAYRVVTELEEESPIFIVGKTAIAGYGCLVVRKG